MKTWRPDYRRWQGQATGVWARRFSITRYGLKLCLAGKAIRFFILIAFLQGLVLSVLFGLLGQIVNPESALSNWIGGVAGERNAAIINGLTAWALVYPEICIDGVYRGAFYLAKFSASPLSLIIIALFIHRLIALDLASQAIVIYNSKALTRWDYLIGKFLIAVCILSFIWIAPVVAAWLIGNTLSPDIRFFVYTFPSLARSVIVGIVATLTFSIFALAISSLAKRTGSAVAYWILSWVSLGIFSGIAKATYPILRFINPFSAINEFSAGVFRMNSFFQRAREELPVFNSYLESFIRRNIDDGKTLSSVVDEIPATDGSLIAPTLFLIIVCLASAAIANRRIALS